MKSASWLYRSNDAMACWVSLRSTQPTTVLVEVFVYFYSAVSYSWHFWCNRV